MFATSTSSGRAASVLLSRSTVVRGSTGVRNFVSRHSDQAENHLLHRAGHLRRDPEFGADLVGSLLNAELEERTAVRFRGDEFPKLLKELRVVRIGRED